MLGGTLGYGIASGNYTCSFAYKSKITPYQTQMEWPRWLSYVTCTSHLLTTLNCSGDDHSDDDDDDGHDDDDDDDDDDEWEKQRSS